jgi:hypothetical protein
LGKGVGRVARYIRLFGGLGQTKPYDEFHASYKAEATQFHDWAEKYPQSCVKWCEWQTPGIRLMFEYLREREYWTMRDVADGKDKKQALEEIQAMLIFLAHNVREYTK